MPRSEPTGINWFDMNTDALEIGTPDNPIDIVTVKPMTAMEFIVFMKPAIPQTQEGERVGPPSNSEIRRWLDQGAVRINGVNPKSKERIELPVKELIFFPKNPKKRCTVFQEV